MSTLVILESPGKLKKMREILGAGYRVTASVGHVRDLPGSQLGVEPPSFKPQYEPTKRGREVLARLRKEVREASEVLLAMDPDREGEAIAWHLADALKLSNPKRVTFSAITKDQVHKALENPRPLDMAMVRAQEARRSLDRIVGYRVSPALSNKAGQVLSAGRVQSPAVRLVVDREREIERFTSQMHFTAELAFRRAWTASLHLKPLIGHEKYLLDRGVAERAAAVSKVEVVEFSKTEKRRAPAPAFTTSTMQQAASTRLKIAPKAAMQIAQKLYEAGAITYMRTDSPNMDSAGIDEAREYAAVNGLPVAESPRVWKAKEGAQEGHEAIRPTSMAVTDVGSTDEERALYRLIWTRALASQLADAVYAVRRARLIATEDEFQFIADGRTLLEKGWMDVYEADQEDDDKERPNPVPDLVQGMQLQAESGRVVEKRTRPPGRYTEASLIKALESQGIGRPSTYAAILDNIRARGYVKENTKRQLQPGEAGPLLCDALVGQFKFIDLDYTTALETRLDMVAREKTTYKEVVARAWADLDTALAAFSEKANIEPKHACPECGAALTQRRGKSGKFWGCSSYPECRATLPDNKGVPGKKPTIKPSTEWVCSECGKQAVHRTGKRKGSSTTFDFWSCTGFPNCKNTANNDNGKPAGDAFRKKDDAVA